MVFPLSACVSFAWKSAEIKQKPTKKSSALTKMKDSRWECAKLPRTTSAKKSSVSVLRKD